MTIAAVLVAGGSGARLGAGVAKAFVPVAGTPLLLHAARAFLDRDDVRDVIVVAPPADLAHAAALVPRARVVAGGATRQESVARGLDVLAADVDTVLVHDVARPFVPAEVISRVVAALADGAQAAVPTLPVVDTIRRVDPVSGELGEVVDRSALLAMQTPQGFRRDLLARAHAAGGFEATDDAALVQALGGHVVAVAGDERAFKITVPADLARAEALAGSPA
jgi:2-C-methyl-D-erythritol 4-phosphate cytidylyltransferase